MTSKSVNVSKQLYSRQLAGIQPNQNNKYMIKFEDDTRAIRYVENQMEAALKQGRGAYYTKLDWKKRRMELERKNNLQKIVSSKK